MHFLGRCDMKLPHVQPHKKQNQSRESIPELPERQPASAASRLSSQIANCVIPVCLLLLLAQKRRVGVKKKSPRVLISAWKIPQKASSVFSPFFVTFVASDE